MPSRPLAALRRIGPPAALLGGIALLAGSVSGIASIDGRLAGGADRGAPARERPVVRLDRPPGHDCPPPAQRRPGSAPAYF
jgi:hypothetical protein